MRMATSQSSTFMTQWDTLHCSPPLNLFCTVQSNHVYNLLFSQNAVSGLFTPPVPDHMTASHLLGLLLTWCI